MVRDTAPTGETIEELRDRIERAREQIAQVEQGRGQLLSRIEDFESRVGVLAAQVERVLHEGPDLAQLATERDRLKRQVEDQRREIERLRQELRGRDDYIRRLRAQIEAGERTVAVDEARTDEIADLTDERDHLAEEVDRLQATLVEREGRIAEIQTELTAVWDEWDMMDREVQALTERVNELDDYVQLVNDELDRRSEENQSLQREMARLRQELEHERSARASAVDRADREASNAVQLAETVRLLERQLAEYREKLATVTVVAPPELVNGERLRALEHENSRLRRQIDPLIERERQIAEALRTIRPILEAFRRLADVVEDGIAGTEASALEPVEPGDISGAAPNESGRETTDRGPSVFFLRRPSASAPTDGGRASAPSETSALEDQGASQSDDTIAPNGIGGSSASHTGRSASTDSPSETVAETFDDQDAPSERRDTGQQLDVPPDSSLEARETVANETEQTVPMEYDPPRRDLLLATWLIVPPSSFIANDLARHLERHLHLERPLLVLAEVLRRMPESQRRSRNPSFFRGTVIERARSLARNRGKPITASLPSKVVEATGPLTVGDWLLEPTGFHVDPVETGRVAILHLRVRSRADSRTIGAPLYVVLFSNDRVFHWSPLASARHEGRCPSSCAGPATVITLPSNGTIEGHLVFPLSEDVTPTHYGLIDGDRLEIRRVSSELRADPTQPTS